MKLTFVVGSFLDFGLSLLVYVCALLFCVFCLCIVGHFGTGFVGYD